MAALHDIVTKGSTDRSVTLRCIDATTGAPKTDVVFNSSGIALWYRREGAALTSITEATLAALTTAHSDGGFLHIADGDYRLDLPDAAFATGVNHVDFGGTVTGGVFIGGRVRLVDSNLETANMPANVVQISGDSTAADNLENAFDDTAGPVPWAGIVDQGTAQSASSTGLVLRAAAAFADDTLIGATLLVLGSTQGYWQTRQITDNALSGDTVTVDPAWTVKPSGTITYKILAGPPTSTAAPVAANVTQFGGVNGTFSGGRPEVNTTLIEGSDATNQIRDAVVDDATRIDASALNTLSSHDPGETIMGATDLGTGAGLTSLASAADLATVAGYLDTEIAAILADTNELQTDWANGGRLDNILDARASQTSVDTVDGVVDAIKVTTDKLDTTLELGDTDGNYQFTTLALENAPSGSGPTAAAIADAVWEEAIADHSGTSGSTAEALSAAGAAGDPWITALPGSYGAGQAGFIIGTNMNATVGSRASQTSVDDLPTNAEFAAGLAAADDAVLAAIDALPTAVENADALLDRNMATGADSGSTSVRTPRQALRILRNKWTIDSDGVQTITKEDDSTTSWTQQLSTDGAAQPVTGTDPAGP